MNGLSSPPNPAPADAGAVLAEIDALRARLAALERQVLGGLAHHHGPMFVREWIDRVANLVAIEWGITAEELWGTRREGRFTRPRFVWAWLVKQIGRLSYTQAAVQLGYGDHTCVMHACRRVEGWRETNPDFRLVTDTLLDIGRAVRAPGQAARLTEEATT